MTIDDHQTKIIEEWAEHTGLPASQILNAYQEAIGDNADPEKAKKFPKLAALEVTQERVMLLTYNGYSALVSLDKVDRTCNIAVKKGEFGKRQNKSTDPALIEKMLATVVDECRYTLDVPISEIPISIFKLIKQLDPTYTVEQMFSKGDV